MKYWNLQDAYLKCAVNKLDLIDDVYVQIGINLQFTKSFTLIQSTF